MIEIASHGGSRGDFAIWGLTPDEINKMLAVMSGSYWVRVVDGRAHFVASYVPLPDHLTDDELLPFWRKVSSKEVGNLTQDILDTEALGEHDSPSISIRHLCGYSYTPEGYRHQATKLESFGFQCMRSKRGADGKFWETWFLPGLLFAEGDLKEAISSGKSAKLKFESAINFLRRNISFGTLDASIQKLAAVMD